MRLPEKGNLNSHGTRPIQQTISVIKWIRTSRLSKKNTLCLVGVWYESPVEVSQQKIGGSPAASSPASSGVELQVYDRCNDAEINNEITLH